MAQALSYFGHVARTQTNSLEKAVMQGLVEGYRKPGRPKSRYIDRIKNITGQPLQNIYRLEVAWHQEGSQAVSHDGGVSKQGKAIMAIQDLMVIQSKP